MPQARLFGAKAVESDAVDRSGARRKFALGPEREEIVHHGAREPDPVGRDPGAVDPLLDAAEREGQLLARVARQEREIAALRKKLEQTELALAEARERIAVLSIHEAPTNPPPRTFDEAIDEAARMTLKPDPSTR